MDAYQPEPWHDFFLATSGAAAALTGLLFVALSMHIRYIATDPAYRRMARGSLIGLVQALVFSLAVLVSQPGSWLGFELAFTGLFYVVAFGGFQLVAVWRARWRISAAAAIRSGLGYLLGLIGFVGGLGVAFQWGPGLYLIALVAIAIIAWNLLNAWVLLMGVADEEIEAETARPLENLN